MGSGAAGVAAWFTDAPLALVMVPSLIGKRAGLPFGDCAEGGEGCLLRALSIPSVWFEFETFSGLPGGDCY